MNKAKNISYIMLLTTFSFVAARAQCTLTLSDYTQVEVLACLSSCGCSELVIPTGTTVNMTGDWDLTSAGIITFTIQGTGSLVFSGAGQNRDELTMVSGSVLIIEDTTNTDALASSPPALGNPRITIGSTVYRGADFQDIIDAGGADEDGVLPITLIFFRASYKEDFIDLTWATASEENFDYFSIERATDGVNFIEIARVDGMGESTVRVEYDYTDEFPIEGRSYYRLRSIDFDGYTEVFEYKMVDVEGVSKDFNIFPNPIEDGRFSLQVNFEVGSDAQLIVFNAMGGIEMRMNVGNWLSGHYLQGLKPGTYLFRLVSAEGIMVKRVLVK